MAGLLAWAADVVGGGTGGKSDEDNDHDSIPLIFTPEQQAYAQELDFKSSSLNRAIQDLRLRLPPADISERLPHLHAHSIASNAALAMQLNAHSTTKQQVQQREVRLLEENKEYENAISNCEHKIQEKLQEADALLSKLKVMELTEENLKAELQSAQTAKETRADVSCDELNEPKSTVEAKRDVEAHKSELVDKLENMKKELVSMEDSVQVLEKKWQQVQDNALKQPTPGQREKTLDKQLHSLIEQLEAKQAQAERLVHEVHLKEMELERLNGLWRGIENRESDITVARNRIGRNSAEKGSMSSDYVSDSYNRLPIHTAGRSETLQRLMLLRSAFVLYLLVLHILVFIKISF